MGGEGVAGQRVLVVDDERYLADMVATALRYEGFVPEVAGSGRETLALVERFNPDLIVLDVMLPDGSGMDTCERLRRSGWAAPVIFLTARDSVGDKVTGLSSGGDDYMTKPFSIEELIARVRAVLRRAGERRPDSQLTFADLTLDDITHEVSRAGTFIDLTPTEFRLLRYLMVNANRVVTKRQIIDQVWDYGFSGSDAIVQTYISYLRQKIDKRDPVLIHTVPRIGYALRLPRKTGGQRAAGA